MLFSTYPISIIGIVITLILSQNIPVCTPTFFIKLKNSKQFVQESQYIYAKSNSVQCKHINLWYVSLSLHKCYCLHILSV